MQFTRFDDAFWSSLDALVQSSEIVIDRPKGSVHPNYPEFVYPVDYGYLKGTTAMDGGGIDIWHGSSPIREINAILCIVDLHKRDSEIKILFACTDDEQRVIYGEQNTEGMQAIYVPRRVR